MRISESLRQIADAERSACPVARRQAIVLSRKPIEEWRQSRNGKDVEIALKAVLALPIQARVSAFRALLMRHTDWLASYLRALFDAARTDSTWQPPLTNFATDRHVGLYLAETAEVKLSLILIHGNEIERADPPPILRLTSGHVMLCPVGDGIGLSLSYWQLQRLSNRQQLVRQSDCIVPPDGILHCHLSHGYWHIASSPSPILMLRLEWPEETVEQDRYFDAQTGAPLPHIMGSDRFRRHMAMTALFALSPNEAAEQLPIAIDTAPDDALAWHYCRQLLAVAPEQALPILNRLSATGSAYLRQLAAQTLSVLKTHYASLFEAA